MVPNPSSSVMPTGTVDITMGTAFIVTQQGDIVDRTGSTITLDFTFELSTGPMVLDSVVVPLASDIQELAIANAIRTRLNAALSASTRIFTVDSPVDSDGNFSIAIRNTGFPSAMELDLVIENGSTGVLSTRITESRSVIGNYTGQPRGPGSMCTVRRTMALEANNAFRTFELDPRQDIAANNANIVSALSGIGFYATNTMGVLDIQDVSVLDSDTELAITFQAPPGGTHTLAVNGNMDGEDPVPATLRGIAEDSGTLAARWSRPVNTGRQVN